MFKYSVVACIIGFILDFIFGDPNFSLHPIRMIGKLIELCEKFVLKLFKNKFLGGIFIVIFVCLISVLFSVIVLWIAYTLNIYFGIFVESIICYFMLATKSLKKESMKVYKKLKYGTLDEGRKAVSMIVGRDTENLTKEGVIKATVETVAENLSDGVISPMLYMLFGGAVLGVFYKSVNTMDSMIGYKNDKYILLGRCAAKLDDLVNFIPSRISAVMLILASVILKKDFKNAVKIFKRDRFNHSSPNSAQTEAACAGALRIQLAGNAYYFGRLYEKPFIGDFLENIAEEHIIAVNNMMYTASILTMIIFGNLFFWVGVIL